MSRGGDSGKTLDLAPMHIQAMRRFFDKINPPTGECWEWSGAKTGRYGSLGVGAKGSATTYRAHRLAYSLMRGPIPDGFGTDHLCRNPSCVNPWHMELVLDRTNRERQNTSRPRLDGGRVRAIRKARRITVKELAVLANMSDATIYNIERGVSNRVQPATARKLAAALDCDLSEIAEVVEVTS